MLSLRHAAHGLKIDLADGQRTYTRSATVADWPLIADFFADPTRCTQIDRIVRFGIELSGDDLELEWRLQFAAPRGITLITAAEGRPDHLIAVASGRPLTPVKPDVLEARVTVARTHRRLGLASELAPIIRQQASKKDYTAVVVRVDTTNWPMIRFAETLGAPVQEGTARGLEEWMGLGNPAPFRPTAAASSYLRAEL